jgi:hypothetical protein
MDASEEGQKLSRFQKWHRANKDKSRLYRLKHWKRELELKRKRRLEHPEILHAQNQKAKSRKSAWLRNWRKSNPEKNKAYGRNSRPTQYRRYKQRRKTDPQFVMAERIRGRLGVALSRQLAKKHKSTFSLLGCSMPEFIERMEALFVDGMNWTNRTEWHLDHIVPVMAFDLLDVEEQSVCFNWRNFQPLWGKDNLVKSDTIPNPLPSFLPPHIAQRIIDRQKQ